ncbi:hypothetical protein OPW39_15630 [Vibrio europaeus]|uniref:hypothetical protein n=1 Tax=Vibrio europaeus TaxID=300876 RepID=UPI00233ECAA2|nr:hypothetical protein [Vibrio europaeus]MDC5870238.1 hypothetical protein [Vibrio europaeus]
MSTNALLTLHDMQPSGHNAITTVTFYRHWDGYMGKATAQTFYNLFANPAEAKGGFLETFIANNAKDVELHDFAPYTVDDCMNQYHYHLDCKTFQLVVWNCEWNEEPKIVFSGCVTDFINQYSESTKAVLSYAEWNKNAKEVYTPDMMIRRMASDFKTLDRCYKQGSSNANNPSCLKRINRYICMLGDMNLSPEIADYRENSLKLVMSYEEIINAVDASHAIQQVKDEENTTHVMIGEKPVSITLLD